MNQARQLNKTMQLFYNLGRGKVVHCKICHAELTDEQIEANRHYCDDCHDKWNLIGGSINLNKRGED